MFEMSHASLGLIDGFCSEVVTRQILGTCTCTCSEINGYLMLKGFRLSGSEAGCGFNPLAFLYTIFVIE